MFMKVLILGASGMLGSTLMWTLNQHNQDVYGTSRKHYDKLDVFGDRMYTGVQNIDDIKYIIHTLKPCIVINCIGIIKQKPASDNEFIYMNADKKIIKTETLKLAEFPNNKEQDNCNNYGYGLRISCDENNNTLLFHLGLWNGNNSLFIHRPCDKTVIIVLSNIFNRSFTGKSVDILHILDEL